MVAKTYYIIFSLYCRLMIFKLRFLLSLKRSKNVKKQGIAALPYYPKNWPGGEDRIAAWKQYFNADGIVYDVYWAWNTKELKSFLEHQKNNHVADQYKMYFKLLHRRVKQFRKLYAYESVWIQRAVVPMFPFKQAWFEKLLSRHLPNLNVDFYDADYESNYNLVMEAVKAAHKVSVASLFLKNKFIGVNPNVHFIRYAIKTDHFKMKPAKEAKEEIRIGWMGSPANARQLTYIKNDLHKIEREFPEIIFTFTCRDLPELGLQRAEINEWGKNNFNYEDWLSTSDIGIVPFVELTNRIKAKISMKTLEFMANNIALISSPHVHSDKLVHSKSFLLSEKDNWYENIKLLIKNKKLRKDIALKGNEVFEKYHTYQNIYPLLKKALTDQTS